MIDKRDLLDWLVKKSKLLPQKITLIAVGGTAMTLLGLKASTIDIDFCCISNEEKKLFEKTFDSSFKVDLFVGGYIFSEQLPADYTEIAKEILLLPRLALKALHPMDIIITKAARFNARDEEDIAVLAKQVKKEDLLKRFNIVVKTYAGNEQIYSTHMQVILKRFF